MEAIILPPPPPRSVGSRGQNSTSSEDGLVIYQIKCNHECSSMVANILPADPLPILGVGLNGQNSTVSEYSHVAYQIKGDDACSDMVVKKFQQTPPPPPPRTTRHWEWNQKVKIHLFQNMVTLYIKLYGI